jgi:hypothetical protein
MIAKPYINLSCFIPQNNAIAKTIALALFMAWVISVPRSEANAHQQKAAITTILFNQRTDNIEVMHRFELHDAEHAVKRLFASNADIYTSEKTQDQFVNYVIERFGIADQTGTPLVLIQVGYEIDGKHMWVYQEAAYPPSISGISVAHNALRDIWPSQTNTVNIEGKGAIKTLTFSESDSVQSIKLD